MDRDDKRCTIMCAALELVAEHGFHGAPIASVAERAGVAAGTIYRYFDSKDALINEIYRYLESRFMAAVMDQYPAERPIRERFIHVISILLRYFSASPLEFRFLEQFHNSPYGVEHRRDKLFGRSDKHVVVDLFIEAKEAQVVKDLPLPVLLAFVFGPMASISRDNILGFIELDEDLIGQVVEACWDAVRR